MNAVPASTFDVVIVGGALMGGSTAFHLLARAPHLSVCVIDKDPSFQYAASERSNAGVRLLFSQEENIRMSLYGHEFYGDFARVTGRHGEPQPLTFYRNGYLFIANTDDQAADMAANYDYQIGFGCQATLMDAAALKAKFPMFHTGDVTLAVYAPNDGWIDNHGALMGFRKTVKTMGATYLDAEVKGFTENGTAVTGVRLSDGRTISARWVVNTSGAWAPGLCQTIGWTMPVEPMPRMVFYFECRDPVGILPLTRDGLGVGMRSEGRGYITGITNYALAGEFCFDVNHAYFTDFVWEKLAHRVPAFEAIKVQSAWVGHYAQNSFDGNMIIGPWIGGLEGILVATGFSGHGLQHAPAVGRALAELILDGDFVTIDLSRFNYQRVLDRTPYPEVGVKA